MGWENAHLHRFEINNVEYGTGPGTCHRSHRDPALEHIVAPRLDIRRSQVRRPWNGYARQGTAGLAGAISLHAG